MRYCVCIVLYTRLGENHYDVNRKDDDDYDDGTHDNIM